MKQGLFYVLLAALLGAFVLALALHSDIENVLGRTSKASLQDDPETSGSIEVEFKAQEAFVSGTVYSQGQLDGLEDKIRNTESPTRFGRIMRGVTDVHLDGVTLSEPVRPWAALSAADNSIQLRGHVGDEATRDGIVAGAQTAYPGAKIESDITVAPGVLSYPSLKPTIGSFPALPAAATAAPVLLASTWVGEAWENKATDGDLAALSGRIETHVGDADTRTVLAQPLLEARSQWDAIQSLPRPFTYASLAGETLTLRGRVRDQQTRDSIVQAATTQYSEATIDSQIALTDSVRPVADAGQTLTTFPAKIPKEAPAWVAGTYVGDAWQPAPEGENGYDTTELAKLASGPYDLGPITGPANQALIGWNGAQAEQAKAAAAEAQKTAELAEREAQRTVEKAKAQAIEQPKLTAEQIAKLPPPYASLIANAGVVKVNGAVADQPTSDTILKSIRDRFTGFEIIDNLTVTPTVRPVDDLSSTLESLPAVPGADAGGRLVSMTRVGYAWKTGTVHTIYFELNQSGQSEDQTRALAQIKRILEVAPDASFQVVGHTDSQGGEAGNLALSQRRAKSFADFLTSTGGIAADKVSHRGAGELEPAATNETDLGRAKNRRVEILFR